MLHIWGCITSDCPHWPPSTMETTSYEWKKVALSDKWRIILPHVWGSAGTRMHYRKKAKLAMLCWETLDPCGIDLHSPRNSEKLNLWFTCRDKFNRSPKPNPFPPPWCFSGCQLMCDVDRDSSTSFSSKISCEQSQVTVTLARCRDSSNMRVKIEMETECGARCNWEYVHAQIGSKPLWLSLHGGENQN